MSALTPEQRTIAESLLLQPDAWTARLRTRPFWFMACLDQVIEGGSRDIRLQLPAFPSTKDVAVFSDYGGDHSESPVRTYSFLIVDFGALDSFGASMRQIRSDYKLGIREIGFKELNSTAISSAVPKIMRAADRLPGLLFTLVVNKRYKTILGDDQALADAKQAFRDGNIQSWKRPGDTEDVMRKVLTVSYWLSMLARSGMGVFWMTDNDNIVASEAVIEDLRKLLAGGLNATGAPEFRLIGLAKEFQREGEQPYFNDALAIADLTAGSIAAAYTDKMSPAFHSVKKIPAIADVLTLHAHQGVFLKKLTVEIELDDAEKGHASVFWIESTTRSSEGYWPYARSF